jgi:8-oxo-dGTP diphosphatase
VEEKAQVLMIRRASPPYRGRWSLPGGHLEFGESLEAAAIRETMEETGIKIRVTKLVGFKNIVTRKKGGGYHDLLFCYAGVARGGKLKRGKDESDLAWKNPEKMTRGSIAAPVLDFLESSHTLLPRAKTKRGNRVALARPNSKHALT